MAESYNTAAEADQYFSERYGYALWEDLDQTAKEQVLVSAAQKLDSLCIWYGTPCDYNQELAFPRTPDCPNVPQNIKNAECEIAYLMVTNTSAVDGPKEDVLTKLKAGSVEMEFAGEISPDDDPFVNKLVEALIAPYGSCSGIGGATIVPLYRG